MACSEISVVDAIEQFMKLWPKIPDAKKEEMQDVLIPCFQVWFAVRDRSISILEELAKEADIFQGQCTERVNVAEGIGILSRGVSAVGYVMTFLGNKVAWVTMIAGITGPAVAAGAKKQELAQKERMFAKLEVALQKDRKETAALIRWINIYFGLDEEGLSKATEVLTVSARNGIFNSIADEDTLKAMQSTAAADEASGTHDTPQNIPTVCLNFLDKLQTNESLGEGLRHNIGNFLNDKRLLMQFTKLNIAGCSENEPSCSSATSSKPSEVNAFGLSLKSARLWNEIKDLEDFNSRPMISEDIRKLIIELRSIKLLFKKIFNVINTTTREKDN